MGKVCVKSTVIFTYHYTLTVCVVYALCIMLYTMPFCVQLCQNASDLNLCSTDTETETQAETHLRQTDAETEAETKTNKKNRYKYIVRERERERAESQINGE